jgi:Protein of unknown function DUF262
MLVKGEVFNPTLKKISENKINVTDSVINEKYLKGELRIITEQARYPLDSINLMIKSGKYNLNPEYQRRKRWDVTQQSKLIESFIINVPIPPIFIYEVDFANYEVMDGLQRLTAISEFYSDNFALFGLEEWSELNGKKYSQLPKNIKEGIDRRYLSSIILLTETAKNKEIAESLKQMVFGRLNGGGDKLTRQESRNALMLGKFNDFCIMLSKNDTFRTLWNYELYQYSKGELINEKVLLSQDSYREMEDVEMVLRFFAYRHYEQLSNFKSQELFLDNYLKSANNYDDDVFSELKNIFEETIELINTVFGKSAFYMPDRTQKKNTPTKTVYDSLMHSFSKHLSKKKLIILNATKINKNKFKGEETTYISKGKKIELFDGKYNSKNNVDARIKYFDNLIINSI